VAQRVRIAKGGAGGSYFAAPKTKLKFIKTGCQVLDLALGGGWCIGRVANIVGDKSTGKTLLCIEACANFALQYPKGRIKYIEAESAFDKGYAAALGMPIERVDFHEGPMEAVEDLFEALEKIVAAAKTPTLVIMDSLDALSDREELDRDMDKGSYGADKAKKMSQLFRRLVRQIEQKEITLIIVSQVRDKIGVSFGRKTTRSGGRALDFYATHVLYLAHLGQITKTVSGQKRVIGVKVKAKVDKNKVSLPFREADFSIRFGYGVDDAQACVDWLEAVGHVKDTGLKKGDTKFYLSELLEMSAGEAQEIIDDLRAKTEQRWYEIETKLIPPRSKYGKAA
jgi:recombination protein RecA